MKWEMEKRNRKRKVQLRRFSKNLIFEPEFLSMGISTYSTKTIEEEYIFFTSN